MNTYLKTLLFIAFALTAHIAESNNAKALSQQCEAAMFGELKISAVDNNPSHVATLIDCAFSVLILEPSTNAQTQTAAANKRKQYLIDQLLQKKFDPQFVGENKDTLLMKATLSYLEPKWRLNAIKQLLAQGVDPKAKNVQGQTALDLAKIRGDQQIALILQQHSER